MTALTSSKEEETLRTLSDLVSQGKILYYGVSEEWSAARLEKAQGLLTGKYRKGEAYPEGSRATHQADKQINKLLTDENLDKVEKLKKIAEDLGTNMSILALAWI
ncbi:MAG: aldo/keto reductase [Treponema sp.]|nr:aldo/keto reductase [Treponema sp.]